MTSRTKFFIALTLAGLSWILFIIIFEAFV